MADDQLADELEHVIRSRPPWRRGEDLTECGKPVPAVASAISRDAFIAKRRRLGSKRASYSTCMICMDTAGRHQSWDENPAASMLREAARYRWHRAGQPDADMSFHDELIALAALVAAHGEEFDELLDGLQAATRLDERRAAKRRQAGRLA
jgi:hypothetical protein